MTLDSDIWVGDLVKGLNALDPANDSTRDVLSALLGLAGPASVSTEAGRELDTLTLEERQSSARANEAGVGSWVDSTEGVRVEAQAQTPNAAESIQEVLSPVGTESIPAAKKDRSIPVLDPPDLQALAAQPVHQPLFDPRWQREVAVAATAQLLPLGLIDVRALVARAARGLPVVHLPRRRRWSVSRGAQLLIDGSRGMEPYRNDQAAFASVVKSVVGPERVEVVEFENAPLRGVYWSDDTVRRPYRSPGPEVPVLVLTDFGLGGPIDDTARATADEWQDFAAAAGTSARILALVPYPLEHVPVRVRRNIRALHWNRPTAHRHIREALRSVAEPAAAGSAVTRTATTSSRALASELAALISPAVFIEPELLRAMRLELMPLSGPETESAVWFGPFVRARNAAGIVFHRRAADVLRERLRASWNEQPALRPRLERARDVLAQVHRGQSSALRLEERLAWHVIKGDLAKAERELERALNAHTQGGRPGIATWAGQAWERLPFEARNTPTGWRFYQLARTRRGRRELTAVDMPATLSSDDIAAALDIVKDVKFGVRRRGGTLELGNLSGEGAVAIMVPDLEPRRVEVLDKAVSPRVEITVRSDERAKLDVSDKAVTIRTLRGQVYRLPAISSATKEAPRPSTARPAARQRRRFLIAAGTSRYDRLPEDAQLPSVKQDLERIRKLFCETLHYENALPDLKVNPTKEVFSEALRNWIRKEDRSESDVLVIYYTGHGDIADGRHYLLTADSDPDDLLDTAVPIEDLARRIASSSVQLVLLLIDICSAGSGAGDIAKVISGISGVFARENVGFFAIVTTRPKEEAQQGVFAEALTSVLNDQRLAGTFQEFLLPTSIVQAINRYFRNKNLSQRAMVYQSYVGYDDPPFFPNPKYRPPGETALTRKNHTRAKK